MGWTSLNRPKGQTNEEFFLGMWKDGTVFHASGTVNGVFYAAVETPSSPGEVWAYVVLTQWSPKSYYNFSYKDMDETVGPFSYGAPLAVLEALTPTDNPTSLMWRDRVRAYHEQRKALRGLKDGDQIVLGGPLRFTNGAEIDTFTIRRRATRGKATRVDLTHDGITYSLPKWQDGTVAIIRDGERIATPLETRQAERAYTKRVENLRASDSEEVKAALIEHYGAESVGRWNGLDWIALNEYRDSGEWSEIERLEQIAGVTRAA